MSHTPVRKLRDIPDQVVPLDQAVTIDLRQHFRYATA